MIHKCLWHLLYTILCSNTLKFVVAFIKIFKILRMKLTILNIIDNILFYFAVLKHAFFLTPLIDQYWPPLSIFLFSISPYICVSLSLSLFKSCSVKKQKARWKNRGAGAESSCLLAVRSSQDCFRDVSIVVCTTLSVAQHHCSFIYLLINELPPFVDLFSDLFLSQ